MAADAINDSRSEVVSSILEYSSFIQGPSVRPIWNAPLKKSDYIIGKYRASAGERPDTNTNRILFGVWCGGGPVETRGEEGLYIPHGKEDGPLNLYPSGTVPGVRRVRSSDFILVEIEPDFIDDVRDGLGSEKKLPLRLGFHDSILQRLVSILSEEGNNGFGGGSLFADHIVHALALRLLSLDEPKPLVARESVSGLPPHILKRVVACMRESSANLSLQTLASESGYSRYHFLRMFRAATGLTPHAYLLRLRLERAKTLLRGGLSAAGVADLCGFSSPSHFSKAFRRAFGQSPAEFRSNR